MADVFTVLGQDYLEVKRMLDKLDAGDAEFEELLGTFSGAAREHIQFEETAVWPGLRTVLNTERAAELGTQIAQARRPRPPAPIPTHRRRPARSKRPGRSQPWRTRRATR